MERCSWKFISHTTIKLKPLKKKKKVCSSLELTNKHYLILYFTIIYIIQSIYTHSIDISFLFHSYFIHVICGKEELSMSARKEPVSSIRYQVSRHKTLDTGIKYQDTRHRLQIPKSKNPASEHPVSEYPNIQERASSTEHPVSDLRSSVFGPHFHDFLMPLKCKISTIFSPKMKWYA
jgi:hypothetical protein